MVFSLLRNFETYFDQKFLDTNNGAPQELNEFLPEELIQFYYDVGGPSVNERNVKVNQSETLEWNITD